MAQRFHEAYERLAPDYGYKTREASAVPWADVPAQNKALMVAVASEVVGPLEAALRRHAEAFHGLVCAGPESGVAEWTARFEDCESWHCQRATGALGTALPAGESA